MDKEFSSQKFNCVMFHHLLYHVPLPIPHASITRRLFRWKYILGLYSLDSNL